MFDNDKHRPRVLVFAGFYLPGFKAGGPIRSIENLCLRLKDDFDFRVVTTDRDLGDTTPYRDIELDTWVGIGATQIYYSCRPNYTLSNITDLVRESTPQFIYLNSFFDKDFSIKPLFLWRMGFFGGAIKIVLAPRGELAQGALAIKPLRKRAYLLFSKMLGLYRNVVWQASSEHEATDIRKWIGESANIRIAPNLSSNVCPDVNFIKDKNKGIFKIVCLARIARNKNILTALQVVKNIKFPAEFHLYGPIEDNFYWRECGRVIDSMPENIRIIVHGEIAHERISEQLRQFDIFFLPTLGENFGHAIFEALKACLPVVISDLTPWRNLVEKGVGWDIGVDQHDRFLEAIECCAKMSDEDYRAMQFNIINLTREVVYNDKSLQSNKLLFSQQC